MQLGFLKRLYTAKEQLEVSPNGYQTKSSTLTPQFAEVIHSMETVCKVKIHKAQSAVLLVLNILTDQIMLSTSAFDSKSEKVVLVARNMFELLSIEAKILKENEFKVRNESITVHQYICCRSDHAPAVRVVGD